MVNGYFELKWPNISSLSQAITKIEHKTSLIEEEECIDQM